MASRPTIALLGLVLLAGCAPTGILYTHRVTPYSTCFGATQAGTKKCVINQHRISEPVTGAGIHAAWTAERIRDEARKAGIQNICYMDRKTFSVLLGIYKRESLIIYGD
jgi:hypothetical protein